jgi:hypothetical protein
MSESLAFPFPGTGTKEREEAMGIEAYIPDAPVHMVMSTTISTAATATTAITCTSGGSNHVW